MSQMYVSHSRVAVDLGKILQCGSAENKKAKLVEDIASEYSVELQALKNLEYFELKNLSDDIHSARENFFFGLVKMTFGLVVVGYSLP